MGVSITAKNSSFKFNGGYYGFFRLRKQIAFQLDKEFGEHYDKIILCHTDSDYEEWDIKAYEILYRKSLDEDVLDFLYQSDCGGKINYKTCKKIYDIIKDDNTKIDFVYRGFSKGDDYDEFKKFLFECYSKRRNMVWS